MTLVYIFTIFHDLSSHEHAFIQKILRRKYFCCFLEPFSVPVLVSFSGGWKGRGIGTLTRGRRQQVQHKEVSLILSAGLLGSQMCAGSVVTQATLTHTTRSPLCSHSTTRQHTGYKPTTYETMDAAGRAATTDHNSRLLERNAVKWNANNFFVFAFKIHLSERTIPVSAAFRFLQKRFQTLLGAKSWIWRIWKQSFVLLLLNSKNILMEHPTNIPCS